MSESESKNLNLGLLDLHEIETLFENNAACKTKRALIGWFNNTKKLGGNNFVTMSNFFYEHFVACNPHLLKGKTKCKSKKLYLYHGNEKIQFVQYNFFLL